MQWESDNMPKLDCRTAGFSKKHISAIGDAVEDLLGKLIETWNADGLYIAEPAAEDLRAPILDIIRGQHNRLVAEVKRMEELTDQLSFPDEGA